MPRSFATALRRANRLMRPAKVTSATRSLQKKMTGLMVASALAPLTALTPKTTKPRKAKTAKAGTSLGTVLRQLRAVVPKSAASGTPGPKPRIPQGAHYLARSHRTTAGARDYKLYVPASVNLPPNLKVPASAPSRPRGLVLMLHGCSQTPDDFAVGTHMNGLAEKHGLIVAYPAQTGRHNAASCWNWFSPGNQARSAGEPAILASLTRKLTKDFGLDRGAVFVAGLSAGGAMAAILADTYPDVFAAAGIHSGLARGAARDVLSAMGAMHNGASGTGTAPATTTAKTVRRIIFHGDADRTVHPSNALAIVAAALGGDAVPTSVVVKTVRGRDYIRHDYAGFNGGIGTELWTIKGAGHAWSGGRVAGSFTDAQGPDASAQMIRFFLAKTG